MEKHFIYKLTSPSGKIYIGQTNDFNQRMYGHKKGSEKLNTKLYKSIRKYGWDNFSKEIIAETNTKTDANIIEESYIKKYKSNGKNGLNTLITAEGGDVWVGRYDTDEYIEFLDKMKSLNIGKKNPMFGKSHSQSAKQKQKEKAKGRYSLEWFQQRNGIEEGKRLYEDRCKWLKERNMPKGEGGRFISSK